MAKLFFIALGGGIGSVLRYAVSGFMSKPYPAFPWGTLVINLVGSFIIGLLWGLSEKSFFPSEWRHFLFAGVLGGFTTFSAYNLEDFQLLRSGKTFRR